jgi:hypothetical protein
MNAENSRLEAAREGKAPWKKWGPYLSERQWGTVREDYSENGDAWGYFTHDQARSRAYRWGEDGLGGISDEKQRLCFALALWNGKDPILKERIFGVTNSEGNHGEDVKEYYYYLDSTPTHSYMKYLYKYPQAAFPYEDLVQKNRALSRNEHEYELINTGIFDDDRYFDVFIQYAKQSPEDILIQIEILNRGREAATLDILPTLWFRNTWSWAEGASRPMLSELKARKKVQVIAASHQTLVERYLYCENATELLFTENETNTERQYNQPNRTPYVKDGINNYIVQGNKDAVNPDKTGTKAAAYYHIELAPGECRTIRLRLSDVAPFALKRAYPKGDPFGSNFDEILQQRLAEADLFYDEITPDSLDEDHARVMRQALAGMLWSKQYYYYDVNLWLKEHGSDPRDGTGKAMRNKQWYHMINDDIISMPDKWEYPWYAAWDLAFHAIALFMVDPDFAKQQLNLMLRENYLHPNGQLPAYEWNFGDVNPPVHAWAAFFVYWNEKLLRGKGDIKFLQHTFHKLLLNFTWWVNRKDVSGSNVFEGGFLGLDNIGVFDRSAQLPTGGRLEQADGTAWMAFFCQMMLQIALELSLDDPAYQEIASKFYEHFLWIVSAMDRVGEHHDELWDEEDGFFYDVLKLPDGSAVRLRVRSMVGLLSLAASLVVNTEMAGQLPEFLESVGWFNQNHPELTATVPTLTAAGLRGRRLLAILDERKLRRVLERMLDENEFLSEYGIRSLSRSHRDHPYIYQTGEQEFRVSYEPAESSSGLFGGNSNWRGPIWFPVNILIVRALLTLYTYYGDDFKVEFPRGSGVEMNLFEVSREISNRLVSIFTLDGNGRRPMYGGVEKFQTDPNWRDHLLFYEYFHGDNGAGIGANHQTGWTGLVAKLIQMYASVTPEQILSEGYRSIGPYLETS